MVDHANDYKPFDGQEKPKFNNIPNINKDNKNNRVGTLSEDNEHLIECLICLEKYNDDNKRPKVLECGHSLCAKCLNQYFNNTFTCPTCKVKPKAASADKININYDFLNLMKGLNLI